MRRHTLTDQLVAYRQTGEGRQELIDGTAVYLYTLARRKNDWDEDDVGDFICHFLPKIPELIDRFVYCGKPFESYLIAHVKWSVRSFSVRLKKRRWREQLYSREEMWEICEQDPAYLPEPPVPPPCLCDSAAEEESPSVSPVWRLRLLCLCLRECEQLSGILLDRIALMLSLDRDWLLDIVGQLREDHGEQRLRLQQSIELRNACFVHLQLLEKELELCSDAVQRGVLTEKITQERRLLRKRNERLLRHRLKPTNWEIARALDLPKGSVDSGIYYLLHKLPPLLEEERRTAA